MKRVLIVTSGTGGGHGSVARALHVALEGLYAGQIEVVVRDPFDGRQPSPIGRLLHLYAPIIVRSPSLWGCIYRLTDSANLARAVIVLAAPLAGKGAGRLLDALQPDVVVSVHPLCHHLMRLALSVRPQRVPLVAVLTDLVSIHPFWTASPVDLYLVPTAEAGQVLCQRGVEEGRIRYVGLPIDPRFGRASGERSAVRRRLGLDEGRFTVLLAGGGEGAGGLETAARAIGRSRLPLQLLVVCGRNWRLRRRLERANLGVPTLVWGYVDDMPDLMAAADVVATKAGSVSVAESLAVGRPILVIRAMPGQETGNVPYLETQGAGRGALDPERLVAVLEQFYRHPDVLVTMAARSRAAGQPEAAYAAASEIARLLSLVPTGGVLVNG